MTRYDMFFLSFFLSFSVLIHWKGPSSNSYARFVVVLWNATEQHFIVVLFVVGYSSVVPTFFTDFLNAM